MKYIFLPLMLFLFTFNFVQAEEPFNYDDHEGRDPFRPLVDKNGRYLLEQDLTFSSDELTLRGILWDSQGRSSALINDQMVRVGETICGFRVEEVTENSVRISRDNEEYILRVSTIEAHENRKE